MGEAVEPAASSLPWAMTEYELGVLNAIQASVANPALDGFMAGLTWLLSYEIFWISVAIVLLLIPKTR